MITSCQSPRLQTPYYHHDHRRQIGLHLSFFRSTGLWARGLPPWPICLSLSLSLSVSLSLSLCLSLSFFRQGYGRRGKLSLFIDNTATLTTTITIHHHHQLELGCLWDHHLHHHHTHRCYQHHGRHITVASNMISLTTTSINIMIHRHHLR